ncbi:MAG TPA: DoxX family protein [Gemmatimonadales bacterium]|nr:DoxX family protein [Gemmatimonadales bacterium]
MPIAAAAPSSAPRPRHIDAALLVLRIVVGIIFIMHGGQKFFVWGIGGTTQAFGGMGVPIPGFTAPLVAVVELFCGIAVLIGLLTRLAAIPLVIDMLSAILLVHAKNGFFGKGIEFPLVLGTGALVLLLAGSGAYGVDAVLGRRGSREA